LLAKSIGAPTPSVPNKEPQAGGHSYMFIRKKRKEANKQQFRPINLPTEPW